jgi:hypothetical protein
MAMLSRKDIEHLLADGVGAIHEMKPCYACGVCHSVFILPLMNPIGATKHYGWCPFTGQDIYIDDSDGE